MKNKLYTFFIVLTAVITGAGTAVPAFAQGTAQQDDQPGRWGFGRGGMMHERAELRNDVLGSGVFGTVTGRSGSSLTVEGRVGLASTTPVTTYTVDAQNASVLKDRVKSTVSEVAVGDTVFVEGTISGTAVTATLIHDGFRGPGMMGRWATTTPPIQGNGQPVVAGAVTAVNGTTVTITNASNVTYTIDASNAKVIIGRVEGALSQVQVNDSVVVQGTVNGTAVTASSLIDHPRAGSGSQSIVGAPQRMMGFFGGIGRFFSHMFGF